MPLPSDITFDPVPPAEGTKYDADALLELDDTLASHAYWAIVATDGSRRMAGLSLTTLNPLQYFPGHDAYLIHRNTTDQHPWSFASQPEYTARSTRPTAYLAYDWTLTAEEVNQYGFLPEWRADVARFCHSFDALPGFESFRQLTAAQKTTAFRVGQTIGGHAWERMAFWTTYDASLSDDWKLPIVMDPVKKARNAVCVECQSVVAALDLALSIDAAAFTTKLSQGRIHGTDRTVNPWIPGELLTVVPAPDEDVTIETAISAHVAAFNGARDHYRRHVAHEVIAHDHG